MEKEFIVVKAYFDDDIRFPYKEKIIDITGIDPATDDLDIILDNIIKDLEDSKEYHKKDIYRVRFLDKCIGGINFMFRDECYDLSIINGNWDFELRYESLENCDSDCVYIRR